VNSVDVADIRRSLRLLENAIRKGCSRRWTLRLWSRFIRLRDNYRCVYCDSTDGINSHHIFRRTVLRRAEFQTGNGITLCSECHAKVHAEFNGAPLPGEPFNLRGGDDQDYIASLFHALERDGRARGLLSDEFYYLSDEVLTAFKSAQGFPLDLILDMPRVAQAHLLWQLSPVGFYEEVANCIGHKLLTGDMDPDLRFETPWNLIN